MTRIFFFSLALLASQSISAFAQNPKVVQFVNGNTGLISPNTGISFKLTDSPPFPFTFKKLAYFETTEEPHSSRKVSEWHQIDGGGQYLDVSPKNLKVSFAVDTDSIYALSQAGMILPLEDSITQSADGKLELNYFMPYRDSVVAGNSSHRIAYFRRQRRQGGVWSQLFVVNEKLEYHAFSVPELSNDALAALKTSVTRELGLDVLTLELPARSGDIAEPIKISFFAKDLKLQDPVAAYQQRIQPYADFLERFSETPPYFIPPSDKDVPLSAEDITNAGRILAQLRGDPATQRNMESRIVGSRDLRAIVRLTQNQYHQTGEGLVKFYPPESPAKNNAEWDERNTALETAQTEIARSGLLIAAKEPSGSIRLFYFPKDWKGNLRISLRPCGDIFRGPSS